MTTTVTPKFCGHKDMYHYNNATSPIICIIWSCVCQVAKHSEREWVGKSSMHGGGF